jgi:leader peptidase (prepilin peptidase)/N-methyltransferase
VIWFGALVGLGLWVTWVDGRTRHIPNSVLAGAAVVFLGARFWTGTEVTGLLGALVTGGYLAATARLSRHTLGGGDVKYGAVLGLALGPVAGFMALAVASALGVVIGAGRGLAGRGWQTPFAFGPCLAAGSVVAWWMTPWLLNLLRV